MSLQELRQQYKSLHLSIPSLRGMAPTRKAASTSLVKNIKLNLVGFNYKISKDQDFRALALLLTLKATLGSSVATTSLIGVSQSWSMSFISQNLIRGNAQSCSSMTTPPRAPMATGMSSRWRIRGCVVWGGSDEYRTGAACKIFH